SPGVRGQPHSEPVAMRRRLLEMIVPLLGSTLILLSLTAVGHGTRAALRDRVTLIFADIDCAPPPGQDRIEFLDEVQYLAGFPDRLPLLDDDLARRLAEAFASHPWVEQVERVEIVAPGRVRVQLAYRTPVLAVRQGNRLRAVDRYGVLLPATAATEGLPVYEASAPPSGPAGAPWGNEAIECAARTAAAYPR
ncbi:MAG TPA: hypothetical protein VNK04_05965, partial [Gemmataceae bacterium]|nr:hypothetical protein [Gemmataceae bacterium]